MRISDWSSDVCSSDLDRAEQFGRGRAARRHAEQDQAHDRRDGERGDAVRLDRDREGDLLERALVVGFRRGFDHDRLADVEAARSEEHTSELQSLLRISYAVFCLTKNKHSYPNDIYS